MVKTYSVKKDGSKKLSENFAVAEFACKDGCDKVLIDTGLVEILQKIRNHFGKPIIITSAYRNDAYNRKIGGVSNSQHVRGTAADICISTVEPAEIAKYAEYIMPKSGGIGQYSNFVHVDVRANRSRWKNFGREVVVSGFPGYKPKMLDMVNDIVWELNHRGIISNSDLWLKKLKSGEPAYILARNAANDTVNRDKPLELTSANDIVWELHHRELIFSKELWIDLMREDEDIKWLALKICNLTENK